MLDGSTSVGSTNHAYLKQFVSQLISHLTIGMNDSLVAMVEYSDAARVEWYLTDHTNYKDLLQATANIPYVSGSSATEAAFWLVRNSVLKPQHGDRPSAKDVVVIVTDGGTNLPDMAVNQAGLLHTDGVDVIAVGVGTAVDGNELRRYIQPAGNYFTINSFQALLAIETAVANLFCR